MGKGLTLDRAYHLCKEITISHYENFPVASRLLPAPIRKHIFPIYAFARHADDLADETFDRDGLLEWRNYLHRCIAEDLDHPIFMALADTIRKFDLPIELFDDLLTAFIQDLDKKRYENVRELFRYCQHSANPVGRIILHMHEYREPEQMAFSDRICTALQISNFWQDVQRDLEKDRIYIPQVLLKHFQVSETNLREGEINDRFRQLMKSLIDETRKIYAKGLPLLDVLEGRLRWELMFTVMGGLEVLRKIEKLNYNVLTRRPQLNKFDWLKISLKLLIKRTVTV